MSKTQKVYKTKWHYRLFKVVLGLGVIISIITITHNSIVYGLSRSTDVWPTPIILSIFVWGLYRTFVYVKYDE